jgi:hypothetical protein
MLFCRVITDSISFAKGDPSMSLPRYLRNHTQLHFGITKVTRWPTDIRLQHRLSQWQAGRQTQPLYRNLPASSPYRAYPDSVAAFWADNHDQLRDHSVDLLAARLTR